MNITENRFTDVMLEYTHATRLERTPSRRTVLVVLPAYNEEQNLAALLDNLDDALREERLEYRILVVDDGSEDNTSPILMHYRTQIPIVVYRHEKNQGLGATIRDGLYLSARLAGDNDIIVTMDADETHTPGLIVRMIRMIREGHDVVVASRYQRGARVCGLSKMRRFLSYSAAALFRLTFPTTGVRDFTCGYRAYRAGVLRKAIGIYGEQLVESSGFQCMVEIILKLRQLDVIFGEVPLVLRYDLKKGQSKMRVARTIKESVALLIRYRFCK